MPVSTNSLFFWQREPPNPFQDALKIINTLKITLEFTENDSKTNRNIPIKPVYKQESDESKRDAALLNLIFNLGNILNYSEDIIKKNIKENTNKLDKEFLKKCIIINYYCYKFYHSKYIKLILERWKTDVEIGGASADGDAKKLINFVKSFLKLIFDQYCKTNGKKILDKQNYEEFSPNQIFQHITGKSGITETDKKKGGRTRRKKRRSRKSRKSRKSKKSRKSRKSKQKRSRKARK